MCGGGCYVYTMSRCPDVCPIVPMFHANIGVYFASHKYGTDFSEICGRITATNSWTDSIVGEIVPELLYFFLLWGGKRCLCMPALRLGCAVRCSTGSFASQSSETLRTTDDCRRRLETVAQRHRGCLKRHDLTQCWVELRCRSAYCFPASTMQLILMSSWVVLSCVAIKMRLTLESLTSV